MASLHDEVCALFEQALEEPVEGRTLWSFHVKEHPRPLDEDEVVARLESGAGVYVVELVYDEDLELFQRGTGRKLKSGAELLKLKKERLDVMSAPLPPRGAQLDAAPLRAPRDTKARRSTPLHGALLTAPTVSPEARDKPARKR